MNILYFFRERSRFIRYFYDNASIPFRETMRRITAQEAPFDDPQYNESGEPSYLDEWIEADEALEVLGRCCVSMLSSSLKLYLREWERKLHIQWDSGERQRAFRRGYFQGYRICFEEVVGKMWSDSPADLGLLEQVALARNQDQHPEDITTVKVRHMDKDLRRYPNPFFMSEIDRALFEERDWNMRRIMRPHVHVSTAGIDTAIVEADKLVGWLERQLRSCYER